MTIYVTYLTIYNGHRLPPFYIGSTSLARIKKGYHGSVRSKRYQNVWKEELKKHPELFKTIIVSTHETREEALERENHFHEKLNVQSNDLYVNMSTARGKFGDIPWNKGIKTGLMSQESNEKKRLSMLGKNKGKNLGPKTEEHKKRIAQAVKSAWTNERRQMQSERMKGNSLGNQFTKNF